MELVIVCEVLNGYTLGVYTSEANAIKGIFECLEDECEKDSTMDMDALMGARVEGDFKMYKITSNTHIFLNVAVGGKNYIENGVEIITSTYTNLKEHQREISIGEIID